MTKTYNTQAEVDADIVDGLLRYDGNLIFTFDCIIKGNIKAVNIKARDINAWNINAWNINAVNIKAVNIKAWDINARNINAMNINAWDINAWNIEARNIKARNILYYAFCIAYESLSCKSIIGTRENSIHKCLDSEIIISDN